MALIKDFQLLISWALALVSTAAVFFILRFIRKALSTQWKHLAEERASAPFEYAARLTAKTQDWFIAVVAVGLGVQWLYLSATLVAILTGIFETAAYFQFAVWAAALVSIYFGRKVSASIGENAGAATTLNAIGVVAQVVIWTLVILLVLENVTGMHVSSLIASLGIGGIAVGLAVQKILGDLFASLTIVLDKPFKIGDYIQVDALSGTVEQIGLRSTRLRSLSGELLIFSNSDLLSSRLKNFKDQKQRRVVFRFQISSQVPSETLAKIPGWVQGAVITRPEAQFARAHLAELASGAYIFETVYSLSDPGYDLFMDVQQTIYLRLISKMEEAGIAWAIQPGLPFVATELSQTKMKGKS